MSITTKEMYRVFRLDSTSTDPNLRRAFIALGDEEYTSAAQAFENLLCNNPDCAAAWLGKMLAEKGTKDISALCFGKELVDNSGFLHAKQCAANEEELGFLRKLEILSETNLMKIRTYDASRICKEKLSYLEKQISEKKAYIEKETNDTGNVPSEEKPWLDRLERKLKRLTSIDYVRITFIFMMVPAVFVLLLLLTTNGYIDVCEWTKLGRDSIFDIGLSYLLTTAVISIPFCIGAFIVTLPIKLIVDSKYNTVKEKIDLGKRKMALPELQKEVARLEKKAKKYKSSATKLDTLAKQIRVLCGKMFGSNCNPDELVPEPLEKELERILNSLKNDANDLIHVKMFEEIQRILYTNGGNIEDAIKQYYAAKKRTADERKKSAEAAIGAHSGITTTYGEAQYNKYLKQYGVSGADRNELLNADSAEERKKTSDIMDNL